MPTRTESSPAEPADVMPIPPSSLLVHPRIRDLAAGVVTRVTAADAGWTFLNMEVRRLGGGERWTHDTGDHEAAFVFLGGRCAAESTRGRVFFTSGNDLDRYVVWDYVSRKREIIG